MYSINDILIDEQILDTPFECDLKECKGACCTFPGDYGAPMLDQEIYTIESHLEKVLKYLDERSRNIIREEGFYEGAQGRYSTKCINRRDCVFVYYEGDIAFCAIEKAFNDGKIDYRKPISCHLFPVRVGNYGGPYLFYEKIKECNPGIKLGKKKNKFIYDAVEPAIRRYLGDKWFDEFVEFIKEKSNR